MNYQPVSAGNRTNGNAGLETNYDAGQAGKENVLDQEYILLPLLHTSSNVSSNFEKDESPPKDDAGKMNEVKDSAKDGNMNGPGEAINTDRTNRLNTVSSPFNNVSSPFSTANSPLNTTGSTVNTVSSSFTTVDPGRSKEQRNDSSLTKVGDEAVHKELGGRMERAATTASSFEAEQDSGSGPRCQTTILGM
ncbi:hypothetical protein Tco_1480315 [Tanacetum coccineum]